MTRATRRQEQERPSLVVLDPDEAAAYLFERIEAGHGLHGLERAEASGPSGHVVLLASNRPEWFLAERLPGRAFRRAAGRERVWTEWPAAGPADEAGIADPPQGELLLVGPGGTFRTLRLSSRFAAVSVPHGCDVSSALEPGPLVESDWTTPCTISLGHPARTAKSRPVPEVWLLPAAEAWRIERVLATAAEDEHDFLLVAPLEAPEGRLIAVREVARGRRAPRLIPEGGRTFVPVPGASNAFIRRGLELLPRLPGWLVLAAHRDPGTLILVDEGPGGRAEALLLPESAFATASRLRTDVVAPARSAHHAPPSPPWMATEPFEPDQARQGGRRPSVVKPRPKAIDPRAVGGAATPEARPTGTGTPAEPRVAPVSAPAAGTARKRPQEAQEPRDERLLAIERALAEDPEDHESWRAYAAALAASGDREGATAAMEECLWYAPQDERGHAWEGLLAAAQADDRAVREFYGIPVRLESHGRRDHTAWAAAAVEAWRASDAPRSHARKKRRWIAWSRIGAATGDVIEFERRRETLLAELASGVREHEAPRFLRARLMEKYSSAEAAAGDDPAAVAMFLEAATAFAARSFGPPGGHPAGVAVPEAVMANACLQTSFHSALALQWFHAGMRKEAERALEAAETAARRLNPTKSMQAIPALAKLAAASEVVRSPGAGLDHMKAGVEAASAALAVASGDATSRSQPDTLTGSVKLAMASWIRCAATMPPSKALSDLVGQALDVLCGLPPIQCASALRECAKDLCTLGFRDRGIEAARSIIALGRGKDEVKDGKGVALRRFLTICEYATAAMCAFCDGCLPRDDAEVVISITERMRTQIDEFTPGMLAPAFAASGTPWARALEFVAKMRAARDEHAALIGTLSGLRCLAEAGDRDAGLPALEEAVERAAAWDARPGTDSLRRMRILIRLARLAPSFGARERGMRIVRTLRRLADEARHEKVVRTELLCEAVKCTSSLGVPDEASRLLDEALGAAMSRAEGTDLETLNEVVEATAKLGDSARGMGLLSKVADEAAAKLAAHATAAASAKSDAAARDRMLPRLALFKYHKALAGCAASAMLLGDEAASARFMELAFSGIDDLDGADRLDVAQAVSKRIAELPSARRRALGAKALDVFSRVAAPGASQHSKNLACDGAQRLVAEVTSGESAFAAAMTRWLGDEERRIRARVVAEQCDVPA